MADSLLIDKVGFKNNPAISFERFSHLGKQRPLQIIEIDDQVIGVVRKFYLLEVRLLP